MAIPQKSPTLCSIFKEADMLKTLLPAPLVLPQGLT